jgi:heptaprenyl diphosphate synthase
MGIILKKLPRIFSITGVSIFGAVMHNIGQLMVAWMVLKEAVIIYYLPVILVASVVAGWITGGVSRLVIDEVRKRKIFLDNE